MLNSEDIDTYTEEFFRFDDPNIEKLQEGLL